MKSVKCVRQFLKLKSSHSAGFTLQELIMSVGLMGLVISAAGAGVVYMMNNQKDITAQAEGRTEINQAMDLMVNEIRQGKGVEAYISTEQLETVASNLTLPTGVNATPVLLLSLPSADEQIVYFVADKPANSPWSGPQMIYRWGPTTDTNGNYVNLEDSTQWKINPVVDQIDNTVLELSWTCPEGILSPNTDATGFYACIKDDKMSQLYINGKIALSKEEKASYQTTTQATVRTEETVLNTSLPLLESTSLSESTSLPDPPPSSDSPYTIEENQLKLNKEANVTFEVIGGAAQCGSPTAPLVPMDTRIYTSNNDNPQSYDMVKKTPLTIEALPVGTIVNVETTAHWNCGSVKNKVVNTETETVMVKALRNGDSIPNNSPAFESQATIDVFLQKYITNGKINLPENQVIYLFEMWTNNTKSSSYDLQDNVVLATIASPTKK